ncbi:MAG: hypothetical protein CVV44_12865 [Spirochaetae bacterium HGW-Spirochaetae-1]|jgi:two-component system chemotaxis sensor kinase CheA|nr:MAG: hypothetical protein CVV44_12865 [Spirochaetae bacterium HGW-Spirochaetae-1]
MTFSLGEYQDIFLEEADEQLQELNQNLLELEKNPGNSDIINNIFRAAHSLKSSAAFVGLNDLSDLAHKMENLLQGIRDQTMEITPQIVDVIFKCFDAINSVIETVSSGEEPTQDLTWIIDEIIAVSERGRKGEKAQGKKETAGKKGSQVENAPKTVLDAEDSKSIRDYIEQGSLCFEITVTIESGAQMKWIKGQLVMSNLEKLGHVVKTIPSLEDLSDDSSGNIFKIILCTDKNKNDIIKSCNIDQIAGVALKTIGIERKDGKLMLKFGSLEDVNLVSQDGAGPIAAEKPEAIEIAVEDVVDEYVEPDAEDEPIVAEIEKDEHKGLDRDETDKRRGPILKTVKVSIDKLDHLLNNVGELVIANSGFYRLYEELRKLSGDKSIVNEFKNRMEQMSRIAKDLQTGIMKTRMVPIGQVLTRFNRLVRDLAKEHGKKIELIIQGEETELDKKVIDAIGEPLMHLIRNAMDHGIELPEERRKLGKSEIAHVTLNAHQGGNQIFVEVSDDGRGLDADLIKRKVIEKNMTTAEALANMDNSDIYNFIFAPGFSTAKKVTDISGRGVGMNVVKEIVNELNGNVSIETEFGMGTRFVMAFPLTLAIIPAIMTRVRKEMFAIPLSDVNETIKISQSDITTIEGHEVINLRGEILSLLRLNQFVTMKSALKPDDKIPVVVVAYGNRKIGLMVDFLEGKLEIVIKSLEQNYKTVEGLAGASILGDGSICLILDVAAMINKTIIDQEKMSHLDRDAVLRFREAEIEEMDEIEDYVQKSSKQVAVRESALPPLDLGKERIRKDEPLPFEPTTETIGKKDIPLPGISMAGSPEVETKPDFKEPESSKIKEEPIPEELIEDMTDEEEAHPEEGEVEVEEKVHAALADFRKELKDNIQSTIGGDPNAHMISTLDIGPDALREFQLIANIGAANAAESLSKILQKRIDLSIPEVNVWPTEKIPEKVGNIDSAYIGVMLPVVGEAQGTMLFIIDENVGFELIDMLYGSSSKESKILNEDGESALMEITNIIGSSVLNVFAEKTALAIKPEVPTIVHDYMQSIMDSILIKYNMTSDYAIIMDTAFYFENDQVIGNLLLLPETNSMKRMVDKLRSTHV